MLTLSSGGWRRLGDGGASPGWRRRFLVIKAVGVVEMLKIYIFTEEGNELELETNVSNSNLKLVFLDAIASQGLHMSVTR